MTEARDLAIRITADIRQFDEAMRRCAKAFERFALTASQFKQAVAMREQYLAIAKLESHRWLWPWMGAGLTLVVAIVAIWSG